MKKRWFSVVSLLIILLIMLSACQGSTTASNDEFSKQFEDEIQKLQNELANKEKELADEPEQPVNQPEVTEETPEVEETTLPDLESTEDVEETDQPIVIPEEPATIPTVSEDESEGLTRLEVTEGDLVNLQITADDPDKDSIDYTFSKPLSEEGKWQTAFGDMGEYVVTVTASDGQLQTSRDILLVVSKNNVAPDIGILQDITIFEGETVTIDPTVADKNNDEITITISDPLGNDGMWVTDHTSAGTYPMEIRASDGVLESIVRFTVTVMNKNFPPTLTGLPTSLNVKEGETITLTPVVEDVDTPDVDVAISDPVGNDGIWATEYTSKGRYDIAVTADDGDTIVTHNIDLTVEDVNMPPVILSIQLI